MIIKTAEFITSAVQASQYPDAVLPEIAFVGRSNVGKSSLINTLVNRKRLVKTSSTPGRTQLINFFDINSAVTFVDLPGYGYAKVPERIRKTWAPMIETYLSSRKTLKGVVVILDMRRVPNQADIDLIEWLWDHHIPSLLVLTKVDKLKRSQRAGNHRNIAEKLALALEQFVVFSAKTRQGKEDVWESIEALLENEETTD
jgi:GTP-binding protein